MMRYVIIGAGAVGATFAAQLHEAGREVFLVARGANLAALQSTGLRYVRPDHERVLHLPASDDVVLRSDDVLVLAVKSQDSDAAVQRWAWRPVEVEGRTRSAAEVLPIVLLQNGLANAQVALRRFETVLDAAVLIPSWHVTPGVVVAPSHPTVAVVYLGLVPSGTNTLASRIAYDFNAAHIATQVVPDIARWKAGKLLGNLSHNLDALFPPGPLRDIAAREIYAEAKAVYRAAGIDAADLQAENTLDLSGFVGRPIDGYERGGSSTWQSLARSAPVESDFLNGEIGLIARQHGIPAPLNIAVQRKTARISRDGLPPGSYGEGDLFHFLREAGVSVERLPGRASVPLYPSE